MKRVLSVLMICALLMVGLTSFASAEAASIAISVDQENYAVGDTVTATVRLNGYVENTWSMMTIAVRYDPAVLQYETAANKFSSEYLGGLEASNDAVNGILGLAWIGAALPAPGADNAVAELTFTVQKESTPIQLTAFFVEDGMMLQGEKTQMENSSGGEPIFSTGEILSDPIVIQPEGSEDPDQPQDPEEPDPTEVTIITTNAPDNTASIKVKGEYTQGKRVDSYKIIISWDDMTYSYADGLKWDPSIHKWVLDGTGEGWGTIEAKDITIVNHSNNSIKATASYKATVEGTNFTWSTESVTVVGAEGYTVEEPPKGIISATFVPGTAVITDLENPNPMGIIRITIE